MSEQFDPLLVPEVWFDPLLKQEAWFDEDLLAVTTSSPSTGVEWGPSVSQPAGGHERRLLVFV